MTSLIFVHGTGGRQEAYAATFDQIEQKLRARRPDVRLYPCVWGDSLGAKLNAGGASIPDYEKSEGGQTATAEEEDIQLWRALYEDPLYEMKLLGVKAQQGSPAVPGMQTAEQEVLSRVADLPSDAALLSELDKLGTGAIFELVVGKDSRVFGRFLGTCARPLEDDYAVIARPMVAAAIYWCKAQMMYPPLLRGRRQRDRAVAVM